MDTWDSPRKSNLSRRWALNAIQAIHENLIQLIYRFETRLEPTFTSRKCSSAFVSNLSRVIVSIKILLGRKTMTNQNLEETAIAVWVGLGTSTVKVLLRLAWNNWSTARRLSFWNGSKYNKNKMYQWNKNGKDFKKNTR